MITEFSSLLHISSFVIRALVCIFVDDAYVSACKHISLCYSFEHLQSYIAIHPKVRLTLVDPLFCRSLGLVYRHVPVEDIETRTMLMTEMIAR